MGDQSGALVAMDVANGDILAFVSMPAFDPNSFCDGIGRNEWKMLSENDHIPLLNKVARGPLSVGLDDQAGDGAGVPQAGRRPASGASFAPAASSSAIATSAATRSTARSTCDAAVEHSCNIYFCDDGPVAIRSENDRAMVNLVGFGENFDLPFDSQRYGTMPTPSG